MTPSLQFIDETVSRFGRNRDAVIPILQAIQDHYGYLPKEGLERVCEITQITPASIAGVSSFYDMFRHKPVGKHIVRVCRGTACHVTGAERVQDALRRGLRVPNGDDTDPNQDYTIEEVACLGCCTLAPVVKIQEHTFGYVTAEKVPQILGDFDQLKKNGSGRAPTEELQARKGHLPQIHIGLGSCCIAKGSDQLYQALQDTVAQVGAAVEVKRVGCVGMCHRTPMIEVVQPGGPSSFYAGLGPEEALNLVLRHFRGTGWRQRMTRWWNRAIDALLDDGTEEKVAQCEMKSEEPAVSAFLDRQVHIATEGFGKVDPLDLDEYVAQDGFVALARCLGVSPKSGRDRSPSGPSSHLAPHLGVSPPKSEAKPVAEPYAPKPNGNAAHPQTPKLSPKEIVDLMEQAGLRGRGGAGFSTAAKWKLAGAQVADTKYVICNGDEGDPGAFMDRMLLESFPFRIIEGLAIAAVAIGAHEGIFYIRHEYPLAVKRVRAAIKLMQHRGWLGQRLLGTDYALNLTIKEGAGAFVCGEETALIASIEGGRGMPRLRPPFPAQAGLWEKPTVINNVETLAMVPWILRHGAPAFAAHGTDSSKGTKVFALAGNVHRGGLIEIPMGTTIREIVEEIGGGVGPGRRFKAVQIGGPSGGCVPAKLADTPVDFESLRQVGAIMGSGGLVVLDDKTCMVDIARYFLQFTQDQSCGKCTFCRVGTRRMLDILERFCNAKGQKQDLPELERLAKQVGAGSLCGLGKTAPNPVLTTLRYFRDEYEAHLQGRCPAGKCTALIKYQIRDNCTGCTLCAQHCPVNAIPITPYQQHVIDTQTCTRCDACRQVCPHDAVEVK